MDLDGGILFGDVGYKFLLIHGEIQIVCWGKVRDERKVVVMVCLGIGKVRER